MTLLIFDCDGVLVDSEILHAEAETDLFRERYGLEATPQDHARRFVGCGMNKVYEWVEQQSGKSVPPELDGELSERKKRLFATNLKPIPHLLQALEKLRGLPRCVASNTPLAVVEASLATTGLRDWFAPNIFSAQMVEKGKPAPDLFLYAAQKMYAQPADCIVIEDSTHGIAAARAAGMRVLGFAGAGHCFPGYAEGLKGAETIFTDMRELPDLVLSGSVSQGVKNHGV